MKRCCFAAVWTALSLASAQAADLPSRFVAPEAPPIPAFTWSGCYVGIEGGGNFGSSQHYANDPKAAAAQVAAGGRDPFGLPQTGGVHVSGGLAGGTLGCNYQISRLVVGLDNDFSWTNTSGSASYIAPFASTAVDRTKEHWLATFRGRVGTTFERLLVYVTGGGAATEEAFSTCNLPAGFGCAGSRKTIIGYAVGAGFEYAITPSLSAKVEYIHTGFGSESYPEVFSSNAYYGARKITLDTNVVRAGLNYRFNMLAAAPVVARY